MEQLPQSTSLDLLKVRDLFIIRRPLGFIEKTALKHIEKAGLFSNYVSPETNPYSYLGIRLFKVFRKGLQVYLPIHLVVLLLKVRKHKNNGLKDMIKKFIVGLLRSSLFVAFFASSIPSSRVLKPFNGLFSNTFGSWAGFIVSFIFSWSIFLETSSRWPEISLYVLAQWFESYSYSLVKRKYVSPVPHLAKIVMAIGMAMII